MGLVAVSLVSGSVEVDRDGVPFPPFACDRAGLAGCAGLCVLSSRRRLGGQFHDLVHRGRVVPGLGSPQLAFAATITMSRLGRIAAEFPPAPIVMKASRGASGHVRSVGMVPAGGVEPEIVAVDSRPILREVVGVAAVGADLQVVVRLGFGCVRQVLGDLGFAVVIEELDRQEAPSLPLALVPPEPAQPGKVAGRSDQAGLCR